MGAEYRLDIYTPNGIKVAEVTDFLSLAYTKRVNEPGLLTFVLPGAHRAVDLLEDDGLVIVLRRNLDMGLDAWTEDFWGLCRKKEFSYTDHEIFTATCPGVLTLLSRRVVAWYGGVANRSSFQNMKAETVMKTLVDYNAGGNAKVSAGRIRDGTISSLGIETDQGRGNTISTDTAWKNLLGALQEIAPVAGGDFDLVRTGGGLWEFRFYSGQRGTNKSATVLFSLERGNMAEPKYTYDLMDEETVAVVGGQGEEGNRKIITRLGPEYSPSKDIETFVDQNNTGVTEKLTTVGDAFLKKARAKRSLEFKVLQTPSSYYGVHYGLGDLVRAKYNQFDEVLKIVEVSVSYEADGVEQIEIKTEIPLVPPA